MKVEKIINYSKLKLLNTAVSIALKGYSRWHEYASYVGKSRK